MQGDSRGKVNIFGGDSIGHCEGKNSYERGSNSECFDVISTVHHSIDLLHFPTLMHNSFIH
jgi:hypothetical protein